MTVMMTVTMTVTMTMMTNDDSEDGYDYDIKLIVIVQGGPHRRSWLGAVHWEVPGYRRPQVLPVISRVKNEDHW